jgi:hypothetical protein
MSDLQVRIYINNGDLINIDFQRLYQLFTPWISLILGILTAIFIRRGLSYASVAVAFLILGWTITHIYFRLIAGKWKDENPENRKSRILKYLPFAAENAISWLYQNVLFYLLPIWIESATWVSINIIFPVVLSCMAVFSCFDYHYRNIILKNTLRRTLWNSMILFAALVPAAPSITYTSLQWYVFGSAAIASVSAASAMYSAKIFRRPVNEFVTAGSIIAFTGIFTLASPFLPPVPIVCTQSAAASSIQDRMPVNPAGSFSADTEKIYAWFAVAAPDRYKQAIRFEWFHDGKHAGRPLDSTITGGRKKGFRTWSYWTKPPKGKWTVELYTDSDQLIGRLEFQVI